VALSLVRFGFLASALRAIAVATGLLAMSPHAHAQVVDPLLLLPRVDGDTNNPPRFGIWRGSDERDASRFRILHGQAGTGAGSTGFDSRNLKKRKSKQAQTTQAPAGSSAGKPGEVTVVNTDWERHAFNADFRGTYTSYDTYHSLDRPSAIGNMNGRIDVTSLSRIDLLGRLVVGTDRPGSPFIQADLTRLPIYTTWAAAPILRKGSIVLKSSSRATSTRPSIRTRIL
jgi:hypothetical protein